MEHYIFSVYDKKSMTYGPVTAVQNKIIALRDFEQAVLNGGNLLAQYPHDFCLVNLGTLDIESGKLTSFEMPIIELEAASIIKPAEKE